MNRKLFLKKCIGLIMAVSMVAIPTVVSASMFIPQSTVDYSSMIDSSTLQNYNGLGNSDILSNYGKIPTAEEIKDYNDLLGYGSFTDYEDYTDYINKDFEDIFENLEKLEKVEIKDDDDKVEIEDNNKDDEGKIEIKDDDNKVEIKDDEKALEEVSEFLENINTQLPVNDVKVEIIEKATELRENNKDSDLITTISNLLINESMAADPKGTVSNLLDSIKASLLKLINGEISFECLTPDVVENDMIATTAGKLVGSDYKVKLAGKIYYADKDKNGNPTSNKWVVLVHGFNMNGQAIADALGEIYLKRGINVLAPDLRGAGDSKGSNGMGYLESLDIWDWLTYLNKKYDCEEIFIHGVSLGGATTVFVSGLEVNGKTLEDQNVIGLIEDCGYASMTGIIKDMLGVNLEDGLLATAVDELLKTLVMETCNVGLTDENFDDLQSSVKSLEKSTMPLLIIHGTGDTTVPVSNAEKIYEVAMKNKNIPYVQRYLIEDGCHASITLGMNKETYDAHVGHFIGVAESIEEGEKVEKNSEYNATNVGTESILNVLIGALKLIKNMF